MPTMKTVKSVKRRFKVTGSGKVVISGSGKRHINTGMSSKRKRKLRRQRCLSDAEVKNIKLQIA